MSKTNTTNATTAPAVSASVTTVKGLDPEISALFGLSTPKAEESAPTVADQKDAIIGEICADSPTLSEFWGRMSATEYVVTPNKKLFMSAFGDSIGANYAANMKVLIDRFVACLLVFESTKRQNTRKANTAQKNALFTMGRDILTHCGFAEDIKFSAAQLESMANHAYRYGYKDRSDIRQGWSARPVTTWSFLRFMLQEMSASATLNSAADAASVRYAKSVKATLPKEG